MVVRDVKGAMGELGRSRFTFADDVYMSLGHIDIVRRDKSSISELIRFLNSST